MPGILQETAQNQSESQGIQRAKTTKTGMFVGMANDLSIPRSSSNDQGWDKTIPDQQCQHFCGHVSEIDDDNERATSEDEDLQDGDADTRATNDDLPANVTIRSIVSQEIADFASNYVDSTQQHPEFLRQFGQRMQELANQELYQIRLIHTTPVFSACVYRTMAGRFRRNVSHYEFRC